MSGADQNDLEPIPSEPRREATPLLGPRGGGDGRRLTGTHQ